MTRPLRSAEPRPGWVDHIEFETRSLLTGGEVLIDGHVFLVQKMNALSSGCIHPPRGPGAQDVSAAAGQMELALVHAPWRGSPAAEPQPIADLSDACLRVERFHAGTEERVRITHLPTGVVAQASTYEAAMAQLQETSAGHDG